MTGPWAQRLGGPHPRGRKLPGWGSFRRATKGSEGGAAALAVPVATVLVVVALLGLGDLGVLLVSRARAQTAADAAALAAAVEVAVGRPVAPVEQARRLAAANGARLVECRCPSAAPSPRRGSRSPARATTAPSAGAAASPAIVVEVEMALQIRLLPQQIHVPARARADVRSQP